MSIFNFNGFQSPPRRPLIIPSPTSPFSTSPSQLEEVTLDYDGTLSNSLGARSPIGGGGGGPMRGRSVKEFEDQLAGLKKENFNLKLRIYFLEERMGTNYNLDKENIIKKNVELMVEVESLRKDLKEKHELLCQADKAMELQDDEFKKITSKKDREIEEFRQQIDELKAQIDELRTKSPDSPVETERIKALIDELLQQKENSATVELLLNQKDLQLRDCRREFEMMSQQLSKRDIEFRQLSQKIDELSEKNRLLLKKLQECKTLIEKLKMDKSDLNNKQDLLQNELEQLRQCYNELQTTSTEKINELQKKLELSSNDLKKSQELVVSSSKSESFQINNNSNSISVPKSPASPQFKKTHPIPIATTPTKITFLSSPTSSSSSSLSPPQFDNFNMEQLQNHCDYYRQKTIKLKAQQLKACRIIQEMIDRQNDADRQIVELKKKIQSLEHELEIIPTKSEQTPKNSMDGGGNQTLIEKYKSRSDQLEKDYKALLSRLDTKNSELQQYQNVIKTKDDRIVDLEFKILTNSEEQSEYERKLNEKNNEIEKLTLEITKKNSDLQGIVNKELWDKNREIEKLQARHTSKIIEQKDLTIHNLKMELDKKQQQLDLIKTKISELGIEIDTDNNYELKHHLHDELEKSEKLRCQANEVCTILSRRLEELAIFLDSLLKQKTVLGFLGNKENRKLREIIDQSLDLTRSFGMSMLLNSDQSLTQLSNITNILNDGTIDTSNLNQTYHSHLYQNKENQDGSIIETLRQQIVELKSELRLRDVELNKLNVNTNMATTSAKYQSDQQSESESWSEPDRSVSRARIGLFNDTKSPNRAKQTINSSESEAMCRTSRTPQRKQTILELTNQLHDEHQKNRELLETIDQLNVELKQYEEQISKLVDDKDKALSVAREAEEIAGIAKNQLKSSEIKIQQLQKDLNDYREQLELDYKRQLQEVEDDAKLQIETLQETLLQVRQDCVENCAKKYELEVVQNQLETKEKLLEKNQKQIDNLLEQQRINEELLQESHDKIVELQKDLDNAKLEYSEIVLEKTKLTNTQTNLEQQLSCLLTENSKITYKLENIERELQQQRDNHQRELLLIDEQKSRLELRISELESMNAQLQNRLIKIQTGYNEPNYRRQLSDHSGYTSEEQQQPKQPSEMDRHESNSSPDLGIESDHGRFSSLETQLNLPRPLLQTLELTESMNNLLDGGGDVVQTNCGDARCVERTKRLAQENNGLKRELGKTKRALEETVNQLALANQRKKQIEKTICKQIHKTSQVLKKAKANLDSGSETDLLKK